MSIYEQGLAQNLPNFTPRSPLSLLRRAASIYPDKTAVIQHQRRFTWGEADRCQRFAAALSKRGIGKGDTVLFSVRIRRKCSRRISRFPWLERFLNAINMRLDVVKLVLFCSMAKRSCQCGQYRPLAEAALEHEFAAGSRAYRRP